MRRVGPEPRNKGSKLAPKSRKMKFVGLLDGPKAIRYYNPSKQTIRVSWNIAFNENDELQPVEIVADIPGIDHHLGDHTIDVDAEQMTEPEQEVRKQHVSILKS